MHNWYCQCHQACQPTDTGSALEGACAAPLLAGHFQHPGVQLWAEKGGKQHSMAGQGSPYCHLTKATSLGAPSLSKCQTLCSKDRKHLAKLLTCFSCFNAQMKASSGLSPGTALPTCVPAEGTRALLPKTAWCPNQVSREPALHGTAWGGAPEMNALPCSLWAGRSIPAWPGPVCDHWHRGSSQLPTLMSFCHGLIHIIAHCYLFSYKFNIYV